MKITSISAWQVFDSRGKPTVSAALVAKLKDKVALAPALPVVAGFDAFVDEVIHVVGTRISAESYTPVSTIQEFGNWAMTSSARCRSVQPTGMEPGRTLVHEFQDGKLMFCSFSHFARFTPDYLAETLADGNYRKACERASAILLTSWSVYPHMTRCWKFLQEEIFSSLVHRPRFFLDLADPASRDPKELIGMIDARAGFEKIGPTTLSLNGNEANQVARALGLAEALQDPADVERLARELRDRAQISEMGIHLTKLAAAATREGSVAVRGPLYQSAQKRGRRRPIQRQIRMAGRRLARPGIAGATSPRSGRIWFFCANRAERKFSRNCFFHTTLGRWCAGPVASPSHSTSGLLRAFKRAK